MTASIPLTSGGRRFLVVDDERIVAEDICECLTAMGGTVAGIAITGQGAIDLADQHRPDLVLMDICLQGDLDGIEAALIIRDRWQIPVVFLTAYSDSGVLERAKAAEPVGYIVKPFDEASLRSTIEIALHRCELERALRGNREWLTTILTSMDDGVIVADTAACIEFMNPAAERLTGWESPRVLGQPLAHVSPLYDGATGKLLAHPSVEALAGGEALVCGEETVLLRADGSTLAVDFSSGAVRDRLGAITGVVVLVRDVTLARQTTRQLRLHQQHLERLVQDRTSRIAETNRRLVAEMEERQRVDEEKRRLQEQLTRAQRMEAVGRLSGGIAHDFNNTLLPIIGYADLLLARLPEDDPTLADLTEIRRAAQHAATLTRQLLAVSKRQVVNKVVFDLNTELGAMRNLLQRVIGEHITLETRLEEGLPALLADPGQIQQVVMNLVVNARDAMPGGGVVVLRTRRAEPAEADLPLIDGRPAAGPLVCLSVEDCGTGIAPEIRDRIFDPFFSTKGSEGTGLGLAVIFSIVEQHRGGIDVESALGAGSSFRVFFPASEKPVAAAPIGLAAREAMPLGHGQRILLVEDEDAVNRFVTTALSKHGYEVVSAIDVRQAWQLFEQEEGRFDMVFSDAVLPDGNGVELISRVLGTRPGMRTLLSSGHTDKEALLRLAVERDICFLQKPYSLPDLLRTVNDVLHGTHEAVLN